MATTYCSRLDIESIIGAASLLACIDDEALGSESPSSDIGAVTGDQRILDAIERFAVEMNQSLRNQYLLANLAGNDWCRWCNAYGAIYHLQSRRGNSPIPSVVDAVQTYREKLNEVKWGRDQVPEQVPTIDSRPAVSTYVVEMANIDGPVPVDTTISTGGNPGDSMIKRNKAGRAWGYGW